MAIGPGTDQASAVGIAFSIAIVFYIFSYATGKRVSGNIPKETAKSRN